MVVKKFDFRWGVGSTQVCPREAPLLRGSYNHGSGLTPCIHEEQCNPGDLQDERLSSWIHQQDLNVFDVEDEEMPRSPTIDREVVGSSEGLL